MDIESFREYCLSKPFTTEDMPFGDNTLVFKVLGKIFALADIEEFKSVNLKCDPSRAIELREEYPQIIPGYHMNKKHWNTVSMHDGLSLQLCIELIDHSFNLVVSKLPKKDREKIQK